MSTITSLTGTDGVTTANSMTKINTNFSNLNTDKIETSVLDTDTALAANSDAKVATQKAVKAYVDAGGNVNASTTVKGIVEEATAAEVAAGTAAGGTSARLFVNPSAIPGIRQNFSVRYLGNNDFISCVTTDVLAYISGTGATTTLGLHIPGSAIQQRLVTSDYAAADSITSVVVEGSFVYMLLYDIGAPAIQVWRYSKTNIAAGGTLMTISGQALGATGLASICMSSDGNGTFYFTGKAGGSASLHIISKYTLSGTTLTYVADVTCGATSANFTRLVGVNAAGDICGYDNAVTDKIRRYNSAGTLQATSVAINTEKPFYKMFTNFYIGSDLSGGCEYQLIDLP